MLIEYDPQPSCDSGPPETAAPGTLSLAFRTLLGDRPLRQAMLVSVAWLVAVVAAGVSLYRRAHTATSIAVVVLFVISAPGIVTHVTPFGPVGLALLIVALLLIIRTDPTLAPSAPVAPLAGQPRAA